MDKTGLNFWEIAHFYTNWKRSHFNVIKIILSNIKWK